MSLASLASIMLHNIGLQEQLREGNLDTIFRLSTIAEYRDSDTSEHVQRVSRTSVLLARQLGLRAEEVELIKCASPMHDVGKVAIPDAILLKPGHLSPRERKIMERHTVVGASIFEDPQNPVLATAREVAMRHHERWDGQGYPNRMAGDSIPMAGRIVALADVFDAVVSRRCYKEACSLDVALDILNKDSGKHFDPEVVAAFQAVLGQVLDVYPELKADWSLSEDSPDPAAGRESRDRSA
jgi:putative two-component system response regulator